MVFSGFRDADFFFFFFDFLFLIIKKQKYQKKIDKAAPPKSMYIGMNLETPILSKKNDFLIFDFSKKQKKLSKPYFVKPLKPKVTAFYLLQVWGLVTLLASIASTKKIRYKINSFFW